MALASPSQGGAKTTIYNERIFDRLSVDANRIINYRIKRLCKSFILQFSRMENETKNIDLCRGNSMKSN